MRIDLMRAPLLRRVFAACALLAGLFDAAAAHAQAAAGALRSGLDRSGFDVRVRPQDDLYRHVNGTWLKTTPYPSDRSSIGTSDEMIELTRRQLRELIDVAGRERADADAAKIADLYAAYMDSAQIERLGIRPLASEFAAIEAVADRRQLVELMTRLAHAGVDMPIGVGVAQDDRDSTRYLPEFAQSGLGLPARDYYLDLHDAKLRSVRQHYIDYLARLLALADSAHAERSTATARSVVALETEIARVQWTPVETRDPIKGYNLVALDGLDALAPGLDWPAFCAGADLTGKAREVLVRQPSYLHGVAALIGSAPLATWKAYARVHLLDAYAPYLPKAYVDAHFAFAGRVLSGTSRDRPRWLRGVELVNESIGEALGHRYVDRYFPPANKARIEALIANLLETYRDSLGTLDWMGPATRDEALAKLARIHTKIGYPTHWIDYTSLEIRRADLVGNVMRAHRFQDARALVRVGRPIDREEWDITPQTVNAYYDASLNEIVFPAAILQAPEFDVGVDDAVNYGAIGATIGHEISHAFDDSGSQYDGAGNLRDWWTAQDRERFAAKTRALVAQYSAFSPVRGYRVDGELTLGENIADNSGLTIAYKAYRRSLGGREAPVIDGLTGDQRFFLGYAQDWRSKTRDAVLLRLLKSDEHAPDAFRVLGAVRNQAAFYTAFGVKPGDRMYLPPAERVSIW